MSTGNVISSFFAQILDILIPPRETESLVRSLTLQKLQALQGENGLPYHNKYVQALVWELKYYASPRAAELAGEILADSLLAVAEEEIGKLLLIPMPMHHTRRKQRGHNQTEVLCEAVMRLLGAKSKIKNSLGAAEDFFYFTFGAKSSNDIDYDPNILIRIRNTPPQQSLSRRSRLRNMQDSMEVRLPSMVIGRVCVIVDDVSTTGATFAEAKRALRLAGALRVHSISLAQS